MQLPDMVRVDRRPRSDEPDALEELDVDVEF